MRKKFLSLLICAATCVSFTSMQMVQAQTNDNANNQKLETKDTRTEKDSRFKLTIKELTRSRPVWFFEDVHKEIIYENPPSIVKAVLSHSMQPTVDNVMDLFEENKNIFKIEDPRSQLGVFKLSDAGVKTLEDGRVSVKLYQKVGDFFIHQRYYEVIFNKDNTTLEVKGDFDNSYYNKYSIVSQKPKITKEKAFEIVRNDALNNVDKYTDVFRDKKAFSEEEKNRFIEEIKNASYSKYYIGGNIVLKYVTPKYLQGVRRYYGISMGNHIVTVSADDGKIYLENDDLGIFEWLYGKYDNINCK
ncbi:hypothetical protein ACFIJ5_08250 [Haloimpatiens sp. FM7330]|uniref:hypothetical protein n=1 Tax=Haloimpatiens sp. FM7330 TaxID=3298610 RepID=UPI00363BB515